MTISTLSAKTRFVRIIISFFLSGAALISWVILIIAAQLVEISNSLLLTPILIVLTLTLVACGISCSKPKAWSLNAQTATRFGFYSALGFFLLSFRTVSLVTDAVWNADLLLILASLLCVLSFYVGLVGWLKSGQNSQTILFLRRFGKSEINRALGRVVKRKNEPPLRLIALDDDNLAPAGGNRRPFLAGVAGAALFITPIALMTNFVTNNFDSLFGVAEARLYGASMLSALSVVGQVVLVCSVPTVALFGWSLARSRAKRTKKVGSPAELESVVQSESQGRTKWPRSNRLRNPSTTVVTTIHELWQETVIRLIEIADYVVLDVSDPTEHIEWELNQLRSGLKGKAIVTGKNGTPLTSGEADTEPRGIVDIRYSTYAELEEKIIDKISDSLNPKL